MRHSISLPTYETKVAWSEQITGVFTIGYSRLGGTDVLGPEFPVPLYDGTYDDLSTLVTEFQYQRGHSDDLTEVVATSGTIRIQDADEVYNPHNRESPLQGQLVPLRPYRLRAKGPRLVRLTTNGSQIDDVMRARTLVSDGFAEALLRKRPLAYWRLNEVAGTLDYEDATGDPESLAYPSGSAISQEAPILAGDPGYAQRFHDGSRLIALHTDNVNPRATMTAIALLRTPTVWGLERRTLYNKPRQWEVTIEEQQRLAFAYYGTDDRLVGIRSVPALRADTEYLLTVSWDGKYVRMWFNEDEVEVTTWTVS